MTDKMSLTERLRNPDRNQDGSLNELRVMEDMALAANCISDLRSTVAELIQIYWGKGGDGGTEPACIKNAKEQIAATN